MAQYQNKVFLIGYVGQDPESRTFDSGGGVANVSLATTRFWKKKNSEEWDEETTWHRLVFYGRDADQVMGQIFKGSRMSVEGHIRTRSSQKDGETRYFTDIVVERWINLDPKDQQRLNRSMGDPESEEYHQRGAESSVKNKDWSEPDDDLPF